MPWELATLKPQLTTEWGGASPFLGAHVAVSRWPLDEHKPRPRPGRSVAVRKAAVLTADYTGVPAGRSSRAPSRRPVRSPPSSPLPRRRSSRSWSR